MKTAEEIKKGLEHCVADGADCTGCVYRDECMEEYDNAPIQRDALAYIQQLEAIDAEPVRHAAWQYEISFEDESKRDDFDVTCTGCGALFGAETRDDAEIVIMGRWDYCPFCGAKMDLEV